MSAPEKSELDLELEFLPAWAKESSDRKRYDHIRGDEEARPPRRGGPRREGGGGRGDNRGRGNRDSRGEGRSRGPRPGGPGGPGRDRDRDRPRGKGGPRGRGDQRGGRFEQRDLPPLPEVDVRILPEADGVGAIAKQIRVTGRAYPVFDIARLVMKSPDRFLFEYAVKRKDGKVLESLFVCELDGTLWLSENAAADHLLKNHFDTFYATEKTPTDPPKGTYTFVAQCGMSGVLLGPPNYHDYQQKLVALHQERFARMPFDKFKSRVKIVRDEEVVKQWVEEQSFKTEYTALNVPESVKFGSRSEVVEHFRATHLPNVIKSVDSHRLSGKDAQNAADGGVRRLARRLFDEQRRFPIKVVNALCEDFARHQLQFFKRDKTVTYVAVSRPHYLNMDVTPVSDGIKKIVAFIDATEKCTRRQIFDALAPTKVIDVPPPAAETPAPEGEGEAKESAAPATESLSTEAPATEPAGEAEASAAPAEPEMTPERQAVNADLHWLIHQGHVLEFSNGIIETAKKPRPRPEQQPKKKAKKKAKGRRQIIFVETAPLLV